MNLYSPCMSLVHNFHPQHAPGSAALCLQLQVLMAISSMQGGGAGEAVGLEGEQKDPHGVGYQGEGSENLFLDQNEWSGVSWHGVDQLSRCFAGCDNKIRRRVKKGQGV